MQVEAGTANKKSKTMILRTQWSAKEKKTVGEEIFCKNDASFCKIVINPKFSVLYVKIF